MTRKTFLPALALALGLSACGGSDDDPAPATPELRLSIATTEDFAGSYGTVGAYEKISGSISGEVDPKDPKNAVIQDLALAPVNARGMVEYQSEFVMLKPKDMSLASGVLRYDAPNRGNILTMPNPVATPSDAVYLERGYVLLYSAWQGDVPKSSAARLTLSVPVARNTDGSPIGAEAERIADEEATEQEAPTTDGTNILSILERVAEGVARRQGEMARRQEVAKTYDVAGKIFAAATDLSDIAADVDVTADGLEMMGLRDVADEVRAAARKLRRGARIARDNGGTALDIVEAIAA